MYLIKSNIKIIIAKFTPKYLLMILKSAYSFFKRKQLMNTFRHIYINDMIRYLKYSRTTSNDSFDKMLGAIILQYHVIEKGLTMPESRLGFGRERIISLCQSCIKYIEKYGQNDEQLKHAIGVILEYEEVHKNNNYPLDDEIKSHITGLKHIVKDCVETAAQKQVTKDEYFKNINDAFFEFSNSRASVRNYSQDDLPLTKIQKALELARNTPSACNRQSWRTYVYTDKNVICELLELQGGNRGFGHLTNKLIIITGELGVFCYTNERNQVYIDCGMYAMNLLYALHHNEIATCILNCSFDHNKEQEIKILGRIKDSEVLIAMVACGEAPNEFKIAASPRYNLNKTNTIIN